MTKERSSVSEASSASSLTDVPRGAWGDADCPMGVAFDGALASELKDDEAFARLLERLGEESVPMAFVSAEKAPQTLPEGAPRGAIALSAADVAWGPSAPDVFVELARRTGLAPERWVVVGRDEKVMAAARFAACQTLAIGAGDVPADASVESLKGVTPTRLRSLFFSAAKTLYADVAVNLPVGRAYTYRVPDGLRHLARVGAMVRVPVRGRTTEGVIARLSLHTDAPKRRLKSIEDVLTPEYCLPPDLMALGRWVTQYYLSGPGETLACLSFFGLHEEKARTERRLTLDRFAEWEDMALDDKAALAAAGLPEVTPRQAQVVRFFIETINAARTRAELMREEGCSASVVDALLKKGVLAEREETVDREDEYARTIDEPTAHALLPEQRAAFEAVSRAIDERRFEAFLLYGITGSGKTEIYLQSIERVLARGEQAIVLVPEISLTPQAVDRFRSRFGNQVGVYHSNLTRGLKFDLWRRIASGETTVLVGARSAIFAPFPKLGLIVVDEEHEHSYKQGDPSPRYHARDVAAWRACFERVPVVLGSATPSLESIANARAGKYTMLKMTQRVGGAQLPDIRLIDMGERVREEREAGLISEPLREQIEQRLAREEQVILFLNRRGFSNFVMCMACKHVVRCEHCDVVMTWHKVPGRLVCHLCNARKPLPRECPECETPGLTPMGIGTQRIEEDVRALFPKARLLRIDQDTAGGRHRFRRMWEKIASGRADIMLGTQMIAKGLHLERVTLVGVVSADHALFLPDFRSAERAFAQLTQVAGRAGRMRRKGEVFVQTFVPQHYAIQRAVAHDWEGFYDQELHMREMLRFPPHCKLLLARLTGEKEERVVARAKRLGGLLRDAIARSNVYRSLSILGPVPSPIERIQDRYRWQVAIRGQDSALMRRMLRQCLAVFEKDKGRSGVVLTLDMDPMDLL